ncbi:MAG: substrate-binding domain-containing protein [Pseudomonadales bacterium]|nr:substrate-binding domain-containing protein [Pseudomonadales bacterium]
MKLWIAVICVAVSSLSIAADTEATSEKLFVAVWAPNIETEEVYQFVVQDFQNRYPDAAFTPVIYRTSDVLAAMLSGFADIGITSSQWSDKEITLLQQKYGQQPLELTIAADALAIVKHPDNPLASLSLDALRAIFYPQSAGCSTLTIESWSQLGITDLDDDQQDLPVLAYSYKTDARIYKSLAELLCADAISANELSDQAAALKQVAKQVNALSYVNMNDLADVDSEHLLAIDDEGGVPVMPRADTVFSSQYPLAEVYYLQLAPFSLDKPAVKQYVDYLLDADTQAVIASKGFTPLPAPIMLRNQVKLQQASPIFSNGYR